MTIFIKVISSIVTNSQRLIKHLGLGNADVQESRELSPFGVDTRPVKDVLGVRMDTTEKGISVIVGYVQSNRVAKEGESRFYSTDTSGQEVAYMYLTDAGDLELNGNDDNAVRFSELEKGYNELKSDFNALVTAYNSHIHITTATVGPSPTPGVIAPTTSTGQSSSASISASKVDKVKLPKEG